MPPLPPRWLRPCTVVGGAAKNERASRASDGKRDEFTDHQRQLEQSIESRQASKAESVRGTLAMTTDSGSAAGVDTVY